MYVSELFFLSFLTVVINKNNVPTLNIFKSISIPNSITFSNGPCFDPLVRLFEAIVIMIIIRSNKKMLILQE